MQNACISLGFHLMGTYSNFSLNFAGSSPCCQLSRLRNGGLVDDIGGNVHDSVEMRDMPIECIYDFTALKPMTLYADKSTLFLNRLETIAPATFFRT
jgi:hypothetical protein